MTDMARALTAAADFDAARDDLVGVVLTHRAHDVDARPVPTPLGPRWSYTCRTCGTVTVGVLPELPCPGEAPS